MATPTISDIAGITAEPALRFTPNGKAVLEVRFAFNDSKYDEQQNAWVTTRTFYVDGTAWENTAERLAEQLKKGDQVYVTGRLETRSWEKDGEKRSKPALTIQAVRKLAPHEKSSTSFGQAPGQQQADPWETQQTQGGFPNDKPPF